MKRILFLISALALIGAGCLQNKPTPSANGEDAPIVVNEEELFADERLILEEDALDQEQESFLTESELSEQEIENIQIDF